MKPVYIKIQAFGSYQEECISFEHVKQGLFLITGDTGAGKTTIFDAVTFALYGRTSGGKRDGKMMRSQYAPLDKKTEVEFCFTYRGKEYTIIRSPEQENWKKIETEEGEELYKKLATARKPRVELIMPDHTSYPGKIKEINEKIEEIIGLSAEQFTQIAMLAQGDFMKLLHASSQERREIFAKIFNTQLYARMEQEIAQRAKNMNIQLSANKNDIKKELDRITCTEDSQYAKEWNTDRYQERFSENSSGELMELVFHICEEGKEKLEHVENDKNDTQERISVLEDRMQLARTVNQYFEDLHQWKEKEAQLKKQEADIEELNIRIQAGQRAQEVKADYDHLKTKEAEIQECHQRMKELDSWIQEHQKEKEELQRQAETARRKYDQESPQLHAAIHAIEKSLEIYDELELLMIQKQKTEVGMVQANRELEETNHKKADCEKNAKELSENMDKLKEHTMNPELLEKELEITENRKREIAAVQKLRQRLSELGEELKQKEENYQKAEEQEEESQNNYEKIYQNFLSSQVLLLQKELKEGEPCPVCGAVHHGQPVSEHLQESAPIDEKQLKREKTKWDKISEAKNTAYRQMQDKASEKKAVFKTMEDCCRNLYGDTAFSVEEQELKERLEADYEEICRRLEERKERKQQADDYKEKLLKQEEQLTELNDKIALYTQNIQDKTTQLQQLTIETSSKEASIQALNKQLLHPDRASAQKEQKKKKRSLKELEKAAEQQENDYQAFELEMNQNTGKLSSEKENYQRLQTAQKKAEGKYKESLQAQGFENTQEFLEAFLEKSCIGEYQQKIEDYRTSLAVAHNNMERLRKETEGKEKKDISHYETEIKNLKERRIELDKESKILFNLTEVNKKAYQKSCALYSQRETLQKTASIYINLDNTANGRLSGKHMNFQTYIQRRYFRQIIDRANRRLYQMSGSQFLLQCRDMENLGTQGQVGLDLDVYSIVNDQTRDVKTLSGGESFMAALAMALGMADIIQESHGSVHIDTMFIDEGFGSLSEETRGKAIQVLNELSEGKRLVGIISHVSELKSQVETKLQISKTDRGSRAHWEM